MSTILSRRLESNGITIIFEDADILILNKPAPYLSLPDRFNTELPNMFSLLNSLYGKIFTVHRLDRETSGVILFAKSAEAHAHLSEQFSAHTIEKTYHAIVVGNPPKENGSIELPISEGSRGKMRIDYNGGKPSATTYHLLERFQGYSYVEITPLSGRTHQIRLHLSAIGIPILCDQLYGGGNAFLLSGIKPNFKIAGDEEHPLMNRTALHASSLMFTHPGSGVRQTITADLPKEMTIVLKYLRKFRGLAITP